MTNISTIGPKELNPPYKFLLAYGKTISASLVAKELMSIARGSYLHCGIPVMQCNNPVSSVPPSAMMQYMGYQPYLA